MWWKKVNRSQAQRDCLDSGSENGFGWKINDTIGAQIVTVPMAVALKVVRDTYITSLVVLVVTFAIIFVILNLLLHYLVMTPVKRVTAMADAVSLGIEDIEPYVKPGKDEISSLSVSFNRMRESLKHAMEMQIIRKLAYATLPFSFSRPAHNVTQPVGVGRDAFHGFAHQRLAPPWHALPLDRVQQVMRRYRPH